MAKLQKYVLVRLFVKPVQAVRLGNEKFCTRSRLDTIPNGHDSELAIITV